MAVEMSRVSEEMESIQHSKSTNELWRTFKAAMSDAMDKYIPTKICKSREQLPYMTPDIVKLIKKRNRLYKKRQRAKKNFCQSNIHRFLIVWSRGK